MTPEHKGENEVHQPYCTCIACEPSIHSPSDTQKTEGERKLRNDLDNFWISEKSRWNGNKGNPFSFERFYTFIAQQISLAEKNRDTKWKKAIEDLQRNML